MYNFWKWTRGVSPYIYVWPTLLLGRRWIRYSPLLARKGMRIQMHLLKRINRLLIACDGRDMLVRDIQLSCHTCCLAQNVGTRIRSRVRSRNRSGARAGSYPLVIQLSGLPGSWLWFQFVDYHDRFGVVQTSIRTNLINKWIPVTHHTSRVLESIWSTVCST